MAEILRTDDGSVLVWDEGDIASIRLSEAPLDAAANLRLRDLFHAFRAAHAERPGQAPVLHIDASRPGEVDRRFHLFVNEFKWLNAHGGELVICDPQPALAEAIAESAVAEYLVVRYS